MVNSEYLKNLNNAQKEAVRHTDGPLLIVAGAGSGKTKVLTSRIANIIKEKKAFCEFESTIKLRTWYTGFKQGAEYDFNCSNNFENLAQNVGIHMTNFLKNVYSPNNHWGYTWAGNSGNPTTEGQTYYYTNNNSIRIRTLCEGNIIETLITGD